MDGISALWSEGSVFLYRLLVSETGMLRRWYDIHSSIPPSSLFVYLNADSWVRSLYTIPTMPAKATATSNEPNDISSMLMHRVL